MDISFDVIDGGSELSGAAPLDRSQLPVALSELLEAIPLGLAVIDADLKCVWLNRRMAARIGGDAEMSLGRSIRDIVPSIAVRLEKFLQEMSGGATADNVQRHGSDRPIRRGDELDTFVALKNPAGGVAGVLWTAHDDGPKASISPTVPGAEKWRILMAEDLLMNQQIIADMLQCAGYEVLTVADGASAVDLLRREHIDLILMDIEMPLMGGLEATQAIRALGPAGAIPIVAMTANRGPEQIAACRAAGMDAYICKPVDRTDLLSVVQKWLKPSRRLMPDRQGERDNTIDLAVLEGIRSHFGPVRTERFIQEVHAQLDYVLLQLPAASDSKQLANDLHSLVSMGGHLGLRDLSEKARALMVALRRQAGNIGVVTEEFRSSAARALAALKQEA